MTGLIDALYKRILLAAHPVGSVYQSTVSTNPATLFGGTWEQIKGRFLLSMGAVEKNSTDYWGSITAGSLNLKYVGETGGEVMHTLTEAEMPRHLHEYERQPYAYAELKGSGEVLAEKETTATYAMGYTKQAGDSQPHNNLPPYYVVYTWRRTA